MHLSIIINVLDSHEVVRRQLLHLTSICKYPAIELIIVDDGSEEPILNYLDLPFTTLHTNSTTDQTSLHKLTSTLPTYILETHDKRPWTQARARSLGVNYSNGSRLLLLDVDHVITEDVLKSAYYGEYDKIKFPREFVSLTADGLIDRRLEVIVKHGVKVEDIPNGKPAPPNIFAVRREIYELVGGYDYEKYAGRYGHEDTDFNTRYDRMIKTGKVKPTSIGPKIGVINGACAELGILFHNCRRVVENKRPS
jgi:hypothetical protein